MFGNKNMKLCASIGVFRAKWNPSVVEPPLTCGEMIGNSTCIIHMQYCKMDDWNLEYRAVIDVYIYIVFMCVYILWKLLQVQKYGESDSLGVVTASASFKLGT